MSSPSIWFGLLTPDQKEQVLKNVSKEASKRFEVYRAALLKATGLKEPRGEDRLDAYRKRPAEVWQALQESFPNEVDRQLKDWQRLERRQQRSFELASPPLPSME